MSEFRIFMIGCTAVIQQEIEVGLSQSHIAKTYALAMYSEAHKADDPDWRAINMAILSRWKMSGLLRIKKMAHKHFGDFKR
jgi:hypothetical protein